MDTECHGVTEPSPLKYTGKSIRRAVATATGTLEGPAPRVDAAALDPELLQPARTIAANRALASPISATEFLAKAALCLEVIWKMIPFPCCNITRSQFSYGRHVIRSSHFACN